MKTTLTIEQSAELIKRGVSARKASKNYVGRWEHSSEGSFADPDSVEPLFTLADLLSLLPKRICHDNTTFTLDIHANSVGWQTFYFNPDADINIGWACAAELIDSLYETLCFIIDRNHVKLD